ncbi:helix-turn-helix domain-containing protein [Photobacterium galatheae]|uniref:HTH cro/C1-type domain-containing protein n=1 Tax=Photobacterium galatheae TaxID=1654360 RepID=A0A066RSR5_9GAMM|nr:helix-turn-helix transcriptional regulator [Photobacterium galatheae]KDM93399.1 hypothetical protein EA58_00590 [Photobacterium galatheae]MCM0146979.1 helix-turn-helix transcriptional regulator [Photobacterium galatheae]
MSECHQLVSELKKQLKLHGVQYQDIARTLDLSEGSVKRLLAEGGNLSLERLGKICQLIGMDMAELFQLSATSHAGLQSLTHDQEKQLVEDKALLLVAVCVLNGYRFADILEQYHFSVPELIQKLAQLDRLKIIELQANNRIRLKISPSFSWLAGGPIQCFFQQQVQKAFFASHFNEDGEKLVMTTGLMSLPSNQRMQQRLQKLVSEFYATCREDENLSMNARHGTSMILAIRRWQFPLFDEFNPVQKS